MGAVLAGAGAGRRGTPCEAVAQYRAALAVFGDVGDGDSEAVALTGLGASHAALGETDRARSALGAALDRLRAVEDPRAAEVAERIARLPEERPRPL